MTIRLKNKYKRILQQRGITLVALVITIIILLILAGISISALTDQGIFAQANKAKKEAQRAQVTEWLNLKLMEEQMQKPFGTSEEIVEATRVASYGNKELAQMGKKVVVDENTSTIEDGEEVDVYFYVQVDEDVYKVEMLGAKFIGEEGKFPPVITVESLTNTTNSITIKIKVSRNEGGKLIIYKKKENEADYIEEKKATGDEVTGLEHTIEGLEQNKNYSIKIVATAKNGQKKEYIKEIKTQIQYVTSISLNQTSASLDEGSTLTLTATVKPSTANNKNVIWSSSNTSVATVSNGVVTGVAAGTSTITATAQDGSGKSAICTITVVVPDGVAPTTATTHTATPITYSWAELSTIAKMISNNSSITDDTLEINVTLNRVTKTLGVGDTATVDGKTVRILGFNHDKLTTSTAYGTTTATGKAGISFEYVDYLTTAQMNSDPTKTGGWGATDLRNTLNNTTYNTLSIKSYIKQVQKEYIQTYNDASSKTHSSDYLWLLSCGEIWDNGYNGGVTRGYAIATEGSQYKYYKSKLGSTTYNSITNVTVKGSSYWWLRSPYCNYGTCNDYLCAYTNGICTSYVANGTTGVAPGFSI